MTRVPSVRFEAGSKATVCRTQIVRFDKEGHSRFLVRKPIRGRFGTLGLAAISLEKCDLNDPDDGLGYRPAGGAIATGRP